MKVHELKCWPEFFKETVTRRKTAEFRKDDCDFMAADFIIMREYEPEKVTGEDKTTGHYTGKMLLMRITHILRDKPEIGLPVGYCVLSTQLLWFGNWVGPSE